jgi:hypothetical protein
MAAKTDRSHEHTNGAAGDPIPGIHLTTPKEGRALFDRQAKKTLGISGNEFLKRWDSGGYRAVSDSAERRKVRRLVMLMPFARRAKS